MQTSDAGFRQTTTFRGGISLSLFALPTKGGMPFTVATVLEKHLNTPSILNSLPVGDGRLYRIVLNFR